MINLNELQQFVSFADCGTLVGGCGGSAPFPARIEPQYEKLGKRVGDYIVCTQEKPNRIEREREICIESSKKSVS